MGLHLREKYTDEEGFVMGEIKDFKCTYDNSAGINAEVTKGLGLSFPETHFHAEMMVKLAKALKEHDGATFCEMPFCHTLEAEALGGKINYGDEQTGPRAKEYICSSLEELLELPPIDLTKGRIAEVLTACRMLVEEGEYVVLEVSGPFTILSVLIDPKHVYKGFRKKPEVVKQVFEKLGEDVLAFIKAAKEVGVQMVSYADAAGAVNILGPKVAEQVVELFTVDFLKKAKEYSDDRMLLMLCPKTTLALLGTGHAEFVDHELPEVLSYGEACIQNIASVSIAGQMCMKNIKYRLENKLFKEVHLL